MSLLLGSFVVFDNCIGIVWVWVDCVKELVVDVCYGVGVF